MRAPVLSNATLGLNTDPGWGGEAPLWFYILKEAELPPYNAERLGPVGGRIVAEVLIGLLQQDPNSYLYLDPPGNPRHRSHRRPANSPSSTYSDTPAPPEPPKRRRREPASAFDGQHQLDHLLAHSNSCVDVEGDGADGRPCERLTRQPRRTAFRPLRMAIAAPSRAARTATTNGRPPAPGSPPGRQPRSRCRAANGSTARVAAGTPASDRRSDAARSCQVVAQQPVAGRPSGRRAQTGQWRGAEHHQPATGPQRPGRFGHPASRITERSGRTRRSAGRIGDPRAAAVRHSPASAGTTGRAPPAAPEGSATAGRRDRPPPDAHRGGEPGRHVPGAAAELQHVHPGHVVRQQPQLRLGDAPIAPHRSRFGPPLPAVPDLIAVRPELRSQPLPERAVPRQIVARQRGFPAAATRCITRHHRHDGQMGVVDLPAGIRIPPATDR